MPPVGLTRGPDRPAADIKNIAKWRQSPLHGCAMLSPLYTKGAFSLPGQKQPAKAKTGTAVRPPD